MSTNEIDYDKNNTLLNKERNCVTFGNSAPFKVNVKTKTHDESCYLDVQTGQSLGPGKYQISNYFDCDTSIKNSMDIATNNHMITFKNGFRAPNEVIDEDTDMRFGETRENPRCPQQLFHRPNGGAPYRGRGFGDMNIESRLVPGEDTVTTRPCNVLSGSTTLNRVMVPLVPHLDKNVQNPEHLVEEVAEDGWIRGGSPSRLVIRDVDYLQRCGYNYMDKEANADFWENKHNYL